MATTTRVRGGFVEWRGAEALHLIDELTDDLLDEVAEAAAIYAMDEQKREGVVDTEYSANAYYHTSPERSTYSTVIPSGLYRSRRTGRMVRREKAPRENPRDGQALVGNAAPYYIFIELRHRFIYRSLQAVAREVDGIYRKVGKRYFG